MSKHANRQDVADVIDWEGGIYEMLFGYGLNLDDLPEDDTELRESFAKIEEMKDEFGKRVSAFCKLLYQEER